MKCPYCTSDISDEALACPHCAHDIYLFKPLLEKIESLEARLAEQSQVEVLELRICELEEQLAARQAVPEVVPVAMSPAVVVVEFLLLCGTPLALLLLAHALITVVYDLNVVWLRVVSLLIPLPFGAVLMNRRWRSFGAWIAAGFAMAALAVFGMSWLTHWVDNTPVLPQDMREWKEFIEYAASVGFSFTAGMVIGRMLWQRRQTIWQASEHGHLERLARLISHGRENAERLQAMVRKLNDLRNSLAVATASAASAYTGLHGLVGGGG